MELELFLDFLDYFFRKSNVNLMLQFSNCDIQVFVHRLS